MKARLTFFGRHKITQQLSNMSSITFVGHSLMNLADQYLTYLRNDGDEWSTIDNTWNLIVGINDGVTRAHLYQVVKENDEWFGDADRALLNALRNQHAH